MTTLAPPAEFKPPTYTPRMDPNIKSLWVDALRSGEYIQGASYLHIGETYCCLGVLANLAIKAGLDIEVEAVPYSVENPECTFVEYDGDGQILGPNVAVWAGLHSRNPWVPAESLPEKYEGEPSLAGMNDLGASFVEIADLIDAYL